MRRSLAVLAAVPALMANQCFPTYTLRVAPGPDPARPLITASRDGEPIELESVTVSRCRPAEVRHEMWVAEGLGGDSVRYGEQTKTFRSTRPAEPLTPGGCYELHTWGLLRDGRRGLAFGGFRVLADGAVADGTGAEGHRLGSWRPVSRAAAGCRRGYRRARAGADSAAVDDRAWPVADTAITCAYLRTRYPDSVRTKSTERLAGIAAGVAAIIAIFR